MTGICDNAVLYNNHDNVPVYTVVLGSNESERSIISIVLKSSSHQYSAVSTGKYRYNT